MFNFILNHVPLVILKGLENVESANKSWFEETYGSIPRTYLQPGLLENFVKLFLQALNNAPKKKTELITEIPVLVNDQDQVLRDKSRGIFFYRDTGSISQNERDFGESYLDAPPQRIYSELSGISMYQNPKKPNNDKVGSSSKGVALMENQVVDEIDKYNRKGVEDDATIYTVTSKKLQKDNVTTDEVVKIINDHGEN
ncbi:6023_t:CDS:2 [Rhizophagus irregularis]|nr:6023_t:CDS:2 [Rhizophagus irregularis]